MFTPDCASEIAVFNVILFVVPLPVNAVFIVGPVLSILLITIDFEFILPIAFLTFTVYVPFFVTFNVFEFVHVVVEFHPYGLAVYNPDSVSLAVAVNVIFPEVQFVLLDVKLLIVGAVLSTLDIVNCFDVTFPAASFTHA